MLNVEASVDSEIMLLEYSIKSVLGLGGTHRFHCSQQYSCL